MSLDECFFCDVQGMDDKSIVAENEHFYVHDSDFSVSIGHCEVVSKDHINSFFNLNSEQLVSLYEMINKAKEFIEEKLDPDGYNVGLNEGKAAGQSIPHLHVHVIPRYNGDIDNPRGGVRNILPGGDYTGDVARDMPDRTRYITPQN
jgi:diadenosine tetraphosphate (Ap4A) HIT family hydrolase